MKMTKKLAIAGALSALLAAPMVANATAILFDADGAGSASSPVLINSISSSPGNSLALGGISAIQAAAAGLTGAATTFNLYYQANIAAFAYTDPTNNENDYSIVKTGPKFFTVVSGLTERVLSVGANNYTATFDIAPSTTQGFVNFFTIYANTTGNNQSGSGFVGTTSQVVLMAHAVSEIGSNFTVPLDANGKPAVVPLSGTTSPYVYEQTKPTNTVTGAGGSNIDLVVDSFDATYFPGFQIGMTFENVQPGVKVPYSAVLPSECFNVGTNCTPTYGIGGYNPNVGPTNGLFTQANPDFILQTIAVTTFTKTRNVPEPGTTALLGLGLAAMGLFGAARRKNKA